MNGVVDFVAACPRGHPDAAWRTSLQELSSGDDYLADQLPHYRVTCALCERPEDESPTN